MSSSRTEALTTENESDANERHLDITGINKAELLAALSNHIGAPRIGFFDSKTMTREQAESEIKEKGYILDSLNGKSMKIDISGDTFCAEEYNMESRQKASYIIKKLRDDMTLQAQEATFNRIAKIIYAGKFEEIKSAIDQIDLSAAAYSELLHIAVSASKPDDTLTLEYILSKQIDINKRFSKNQGSNPTPILIAVMNGLNKAAELLLSHGADANVECNMANDAFHRDIVPLHQAAVQGNEKMAALLIKHGAVIDRESAAGETPLLHACWKGHEKVMHLLLDHGADPHAHAKPGKLPVSGTSPLDFIKKNASLLESYNARSTTPTFSK